MLRSFHSLNMTVLPLRGSYFLSFLLRQVDQIPKFREISQTGEFPEKFL
jgi:hypothetical protein